MRGKDFNTGLRGVLFESHHYERMGAAIWLYGWLVLRQTHQHGSVGWVLGGSPLSYREIEEETGFNCRTLERWMQILRREQYIETETAPGGLIIRITKAKKFPQGARRFAEGGRKDADAFTQNRVPVHCHLPKNVGHADEINSSSLVRSPEQGHPAALCGNLHNETASCGNLASNEDQNRLRPDQNQPRHDPRALSTQDQDSRHGRLPSDLRLLRQLLRAERDEAVRRELGVGAGPEVRRS